MTCKVERYGESAALEGRSPGEIKAMTFHCDGTGCALSPNDKEITARGGLSAMGWECTGGKHYCPEHRLTPLAGVQRIEGERRRQIEVEGLAPEKDIDKYKDGELARAAACYALGGRPPGLWPWSDDWWKPGDPVRNLEKAGALIAAEIDRRING